MRRFLVISLVIGLVVTVAAASGGAVTCGLTQLGQWNDDKLMSPIDVEVQGNVYVSNEGGKEILVFTADGRYLLSIPADHPHGLAVDRDRIYSTTQGDGKVQVFRINGDPLFEWSSWIEDGASMSFTPDGTGGPIFIDVDPQGFVYVTDNGLGQVRKFTRDGEWVSTFGSPGNPLGAWGLEVHDGQVYVANPSEARVDVYSTSGVLIKSFGGGVFEWPVDIAVARETVYVTDNQSRQVQAFTLDGTYLYTVTSEGFQLPFGVGADAQGNVYVADQSADTVTLFTGSPQFCR